MRTTLLRALAISGAGAVSLGAILFAQVSVQPQPQADKLAAVSLPTRGNSARGTKPEVIMPTAPAGFNVAELPSPRMMVYAANGDLFVSSPSSNTITVLRDANNNKCGFEARSVYAGVEVAAPPGRGAGGGGAGGGRGAGAPGGGGAGGAEPAPGQVNPTINGPILGANAPACIYLENQPILWETSCRLRSLCGRISFPSSKPKSIPKS